MEFKSLVQITDLFEQEKNIEEMDGKKIDSMLQVSCSRYIIGKNMSASREGKMFSDRV